MKNIGSKILPTVGKVVSFIPGVGKFLGPGLSAMGGILGGLNNK